VNNFNSSSLSKNTKTGFRFWQKQNGEPKAKKLKPTPSELYATKWRHSKVTTTGIIEALFCFGYYVK